MCERGGGRRARRGRGLGVDHGLQCAAAVPLNTLLAGLWLPGPGVVEERSPVGRSRRCYGAPPYLACVCIISAGGGHSRRAHAQARPTQRRARKGGRAGTGRCTRECVWDVHAAANWHQSVIAMPSLLHMPCMHACGVAVVRRPARVSRSPPACCASPRCSCLHQMAVAPSLHTCKRRPPHRTRFPPHAPYLVRPH